MPRINAVTFANALAETCFFVRGRLLEFVLPVFVVFFLNQPPASSRGCCLNPWLMLYRHPKHHPFSTSWKIQVGYVFLFFPSGTVFSSEPATYLLIRYLYRSCLKFSSISKNHQLVSTNHLPVVLFLLRTRRAYLT